MTVVLATYNGERFLPEQLASLAAQTHPPERLVLRDDGSSDGSVQIVRAWAQHAGVALQEVGGPRLGPARSDRRGPASSLPDLPPAPLPEPLRLS